MSPDLIIGLSIAFGSAFGANRLNSHLERTKGRKLTLQQRINPNSHEASQFLSLYTDVIDDDIRVESEEMLRWIHKAEQAPVKNTYRPILIIAKQAGQVVGFIKCIVLPEKDMGFIAYLGVDGNRQLQASAAELLVKRAAKLMRGHLSKNAIYFCEVQSPTDTSLDKERNRRKARITRFRTIGRSLKANLYEIDHDVPQPNLDEATLREKQLRILVAFGNDRENRNELSILEFQTILAALYEDIYAMTFNNDLARRRVFVEYCQQLILEATNLTQVRLK